MDNPEFWSAIDLLISSSQMVIDRPRGTRHPNHEFVYEVDYGYLKDTASMDGGGIDLWRGSMEPSCDAIICTVDLLKRDSEIKLLIGCTEEEKKMIMGFHNGTKFMKGILVNRN